MLHGCGNRMEVNLLLLNVAMAGFLALHVEESLACCMVRIINI